MSTVPPPGQDDDGEADAGTVEGDPADRWLCCQRHHGHHQHQHQHHDLEIYRCPYTAEREALGRAIRSDF